MQKSGDQKISLELQGVFPVISDFQNIISMVYFNTTSKTETF